MDSIANNYRFRSLLQGTVLFMLAAFVLAACSSGGGGGGGADLVIEPTDEGWDFQVTASVNSANVAGSTPFTLTAEVSNASGADGPTPASTLTYYQSSDATIDSSDTEVGTDPVDSLAVGASSTESIDLTIASATGTVYYGACMPAASGEANATDNCSAGVAVTFTSGWDFQVTVSVSSANVDVGEMFTLTAVISNAGIANQATSASTLTYYQSSDSTIDSSDTELGTDAVASLAVGASDTQDTTPTAPAVAGTYYYGACMPATGSELVASDNCSAGVAVTVTGNWDFQVAASVSSASVAGSTPFTLEAVVSNASNASGPTPASTLSYYLSTDAAIDSTDTPQGTDPVASLAAGASDTYSIPLTAPTTAGTYYYGACVPATGNELNATDNCSSGVAVTATSGWDFQIAASAASVVGVGESFKLTAIVSNAGVATQASSASTLTYYQSTDATIDSSDTSLGTDAVASLAVGASDTQDTTPTAPMTAGTSYYGACMPATGSELNASDNCSAGVAVTVSSGWDFQVAISASSTSVSVDDSITLTAEVKNASDAGGPAPASTLSYYRSNDATIDSSDSFIGMDAVPSLAVNASSTQSIGQTISSVPGTIYYGACMPAATGEADATDNCSGVAVTVMGGWDFTVSVSVSTTSVEVGETFTVTAVVNNSANLANEPTPGTTLTYDEYDGSTYTAIGMTAVDSLKVGESSTHNLVVTAPETAGSYGYLACVPEDGRELEGFTNCSDAFNGVQYVTVTEASGS
ncbi:MAG: hypothetical protein ACR2PW_05520 [Gammaproteobacteria bacterium]